jgi:hypothetical protein
LFVVAVDRSAWPKKQRAAERQPAVVRIDQMRVEPGNQQARQRRLRREREHGSREQRRARRARTAAPRGHRSSSFEAPVGSKP